jgi:hypothetical protein
VPYYEIPHDASLTIEEVRARLAKEMNSQISLRGHHVAVENRRAAVAIHLAQLPARTIFRVDGALPHGSYFRLLLLILILPAGLFTLYSLKNPKFTLFTSVEYALCETDAFRGIQRMKAGTGTRLTRPALFRILQLAWICAGLLAAGIGADWSGAWLNQPGFPIRELVAPALLFALGGAAILSGAYRLFRPLGWLAPSLIMAGLAAVSPYAFRAYWAIQERRMWADAQGSVEAMDKYGSLPDSVLRPEYLMQKARMRPKDTEKVVRIVRQFHPTDAAYQPAYQLAQSRLRASSH